ncbi:unnamed protein product [Camellia sinensis]
MSLVNDSPVHLSNSKDFAAFLDAELNSTFDTSPDLDGEVEDKDDDEDDSKPNIERGKVNPTQCEAFTMVCTQGSLRHGVEQLDGSDLDEFRLRDASGAAQHALNMAKLKRENAQRLLYRADLAIHKAVVALMTAEAIKAASEDSNGDQSRGSETVASASAICDDSLQHKALSLSQCNATDVSTRAVLNIWETVEFLRNVPKGKYDAIIVDSSDPAGIFC